MFARVLIVFAVLESTHAYLWKLKCKQIKQLVDGHNNRRLLLAKGNVKNQPPAMDMKLIVWDEELKAKAEKWAAQNKFEHNPNHTLASGRFRTGENLYLFRTTDQKYKLDLDASIASWFDEHKKFRYRRLQVSDFSPGAHVIGHYTQIAWAETTYIGCAVSQFQESKWLSILVVCYYGPEGNYIEEIPYKTNGKPSGKLECSIPDCNLKYGKTCK